MLLCNHKHDAGWSGYQAEKARFLKAVTGGAADAKRSNKLNAVIYGGDRCGQQAGAGCAPWQRMMFARSWKAASVQQDSLSYGQ